MSSLQITESIREHKVIVIARKLYGEKLLQLAEALCDGGIRLIEVTFDQSDPEMMTKTPAQIAMLRDKLGGRMRVGAGTVLTKQQVDAVSEAGGEFIISPNTNREVIVHTKERGLVSIPGAMTPSEIVNADNWGADFVKIFPVCDLGVSYLRNVSAPLNHIPMIATGGINEENLADYLQAGAIGAGVSGRLTDRMLLETGNFKEFTQRARAFCRAAGGLM